jgi:Transposase DDE domain
VLGNTEAFQQSRRECKKVETQFALMKQILKHDRLRLRGLSAVKDEVLLTAAAQKLRAVAKLLYRAPHAFWQRALLSVGIQNGNRRAEQGRDEPPGWRVTNQAPRSNPDDFCDTI